MPGRGPGIAGDQLRSFVERIERLEEEKAAIAEDVKAVYAEAKANGFDTKTLRAVIRIRRQDTAERQEQEALLDIYLSALGMTPIERAIADSSSPVGEDSGARSLVASDAEVGEGRGVDVGQRPETTSPSPGFAKPGFAGQAPPSSPTRERSRGGEGGDPAEAAE